MLGDQVRDCIGLQSQTSPAQMGVSAHAADRMECDLSYVRVVSPFNWMCMFLDRGRKGERACGTGWMWGIGCEWGRMFSLGMVWLWGWDTTGETQREPGFLGEGMDCGMGERWGL